MKTPYRERQEARDKAVSDYYQNLASMPGAMKTACEEATMRKFKIYSRSTVWQICQRVAERQASQTA